MSRQYYRMNPQQYEEMEEFYRSLGYNERQTKKLCSECFGAKIKIDPKKSYSDDWEFLRERNFYENESGGFGAMLRSMPMMGGASAMMRGAPGMMGGVPAECGAVVEDAMPMMMPEVQMEPEFNTATTEDPHENEKQSPLDSPAAIFSANVNSASWAYLRSKISTGSRVDKSFVRIEEIINSYDCHLQRPENGELFSISAETGDCPWDDESELLLVGLKAKKADGNMKQNLCFLVDVSGSMEDRWVLVQMSIASIMSRLGDGDTISIIAYSDETETVVKKLDCKDKNDCVDAILDIDGIGGCTNGSDGLENAYTYLTERYDEKANNRVFIFTDGDFNFGITGKGSLGDFIKEKRETGIYLSIVGYGFNNFKDDKMETLSRNGNGNYTFVSNPADISDYLSDKLMSSLMTVAKDVKISLEMNPAKVSEYRLIGYDARALTKQEFHDTEKATDGIGSEHNVIALVQFKRGKASQEYPGRYVKVSTEEAGDELAFVEVHYKNTDGENLVKTRSITDNELKEGKNDNIAAVTLLAGFGLVIKDSEYKGNADDDMLKKLLSELDPDKKAVPYSHFHIIREYLKNR